MPSPLEIFHLRRRDAVEAWTSAALARYSPACKPGCGGSCCTSLVYATFCEAAIIHAVASPGAVAIAIDHGRQQMRWLRAGGWKDGLDAQGHAARALAAHGVAEAWAARRESCPFWLPATRLCSIYEYRPTTCAAALQLDGMHACAPGPTRMVRCDDLMLELIKADQIVAKALAVSAPPFMMPLGTMLYAVARGLGANLGPSPG